jgi:hypothetical protein
MKRRTRLGVMAGLLPARLAAEVQPTPAGFPA